MKKPKIHVHINTGSYIDDKAMDRLAERVMVEGMWFQRKPFAPLPENPGPWFWVWQKIYRLSCAMHMPLHALHLRILRGYIKYPPH